MPIPEPGSRIPRRGGALRTALGRAILRLTGWRIESAPPDQSKLVVLAAPHSSNWDFILGIAQVFYEAGMKVVIGYLDEQHIGDALKKFPDKDPRIHAMWIYPLPVWQEKERRLLTPDISGKAKNVSYNSATGKVGS